MTLVTVEGTVTGYVAAEPAVTEAVKEVNAGGVVPVAAESTSNCNELEVPPPGVRVSTVIAVIPAVAMLVAGTCAVSWVALTY